ncbi:zinc finger protein 189-like [Belonocnema kinseyi]|uniref:zinc finger protein 189-like n=1 Tax=Belonocnema kinseyi TaxID=2817044 RepID=UPI00143D33B2|nr:zinc finger protein 189-like [Belonocnema kinseyi]
MHNSNQPFFLPGQARYVKTTNVLRNQREERNLISEINQLDEIRITTHISSAKYSGTKTSIEYDNDETLEIKEEIIQGQDSSLKSTSRPNCNLKYETESCTYIWRHQKEEHSLISKRNKLDERCIITDMSSRNYLNDKALTEYKNDETLGIKNEIIKDQETSSEKVMSENLHKKFESMLCSAHLRKDDILSDNKPQSQTKPKIQESKQKSQKKHTCEKCARSYSQKHNLTAHQKYDCHVTPQFKCKLCDKRFKRNPHVLRHVARVHLKTTVQISKTRHNCDKCSRSYNWVKDLNRHKRSVHEEIEPKVVCDYCGHKTYRKNLLADHITSFHLKECSTRNFKN